MENPGRRYFDAAIETNGIFFVASSDGLFRYAPRAWRTPSGVPSIESPANAITEDNDHFQPTNINFSLFPRVELPVKSRNDKKMKRELQLSRAKEALLSWLTPSESPAVGLEL